LTWLENIEFGLTRSHRTSPPDLSVGDVGAIAANDVPDIAIWYPSPSYPADLRIIEISSEVECHNSALTAVMLA
jgi:hypothetical protein